MDDAERAEPSGPEADGRWRCWCGRDYATITQVRIHRNRAHGGTDLLALSQRSFVSLP
jgi:hypothetical protein